MLSKSRIVSALVAGLGVALIVGGFLAPRFLLGDGRLPLDLEHTTWTLSDDAGEYLGTSQPVVRQLHMEIQPPADEDVAGIRVGDSLRAGTAATDFENLVSAQTWSFVMDRRSGEVASPAEVAEVMVMPAREVVVEGVWLKFPVNVQQQDYQLFDATLRAAYPARFVGEEQVAGRTVYRFEQKIAPENVALRYQGWNTRKDGAYLFHGVDREVLVDQVSGLVVGVSEKVRDYYGELDGTEVEPVLRYAAAMPAEQTELLVSELDGVVSQEFSRAVMWAVIALGVVLALGGAVGVLRPGVRRS